MEVLIAIAIGTLTACGIYLMLRARTFPVILGLSLLSYAVNLFIFISSRIRLNAAPLITEGGQYSDPLPQALVLTAIVISFGMTAVLVIMALGGYLTSGHDRIDTEDQHADRPEDPIARQIGDQP
ncbi:Na+/H+ antiporter subunit C [Cypionkella aquatica]|uniref:Na+/H+ antiporter subunit C n=1 Tax=Cypionkella aquatica TaxID=1756042 RepID=A0AA37WZL6_9RHOB|nr:Na+/H+ antiporter subunit C [Cypionkella aquatica]GLS85789.1 Na+/H+ antiporter subunit C [Cypionkella aquatica]